MLIEFSFKNYRSFRDETVLSMEATRIGTFKSCLIAYNNMKLLPGAAIVGKKGGGKSNVIRAFWLAVQFIKNAYHFHLTGKRLKISKNCFCLYYICNIYYDFLFTFNENCFGVIPK